MYQSSPLSEIEPKCRLVAECPPPRGMKIWMITKYGNGFPGDYHPEWDVVAWAPLPKLTPEQKDKLAALEAAGIDPANLASLRDWKPADECSEEAGSWCGAPLLPSPPAS